MARASRTLGKRLLPILIALASASSLAGCWRSDVTQNSAIGSASPAQVVSSTPPFATREPERYQAVRVTTFSESPSNPTSLSSARSSSVVIARDGERRREEYVNDANEQVVYIENSAGQFLLLPASGLYADLSTVANEPDRKESPIDSSGPSPDQLLNEAPSFSTYEKIGPEMVAGRMTTKYRVTALSQHARSAVKTETFIWIDESLGMPVRSEIISDTEKRSSKVTTELKEIRLDPDQQLFVLPTRYKKVDLKIIRDRLRRPIGRQ